MAYATGHGGGGVATATAVCTLSYCGTAPKVYTRPSGRASISFQTLSSPIFTEFHALFYSNGVQIVPPAIGNLLTARSLAYWAMDDGSRAAHHHSQIVPPFLYGFVSFFYIYSLFLFFIYK